MKHTAIAFVLNELSRLDSEKLVFQFFKALIKQEYQIRVIEVEAPELTEELLAESFFQFGQNEYQKRDCRSVSVGDCIFFDGKFFVVYNIGFVRLTEGLTKFALEEAKAQLSTNEVLSQILNKN